MRNKLGLLLLVGLLAWGIGAVQADIVTPDDDRQRQPGHQLL